MLILANTDLGQEQTSLVENVASHSMQLSDKHVPVTYSVVWCSGVALPIHMDDSVVWLRSLNTTHHTIAVTKLLVCSRH